MEDKYFWALASAVFGWAAAQLTAVWKWWVARRWLRRAILDEVMQIYDESERLWANYGRALQCHACRGVYPGLPLPLSNIIYRSHYKDAALVFTRVQRISIQMIHSYVNALNEGGQSLRILVEKVRDEHAHGVELSEGDLDLYGQSVRGMMETIGQLRWHIHHHLTHPLFPIMDFGTETHATYLKNVESVRADIEKIAKRAVNLTKDDFERVYDPRYFQTTQSTAD